MAEIDMMILSEDMGPSVSMAHLAENNEEFIKESFQLRRTNSLKYSKKKSNWDESIVAEQQQEQEHLTIKESDDLNYLIPRQNTEYVDYLTYQWNNFEIINSWKFIKLKNCNNNNNSNLLNNQRLENISWRIYYRLKLQKCNFITKFDDLVWLYGPLIHKDKSIPGITNNSSSLKPILKKRNLRDTFVKNSIWNINKKQKNSRTNSRTNCRHIRFNNNVQQCISILNNSQTNIKRLPSLQLNYNDTDNDDSCSSSDNIDSLIFQTNKTRRNFAISHNVTTQRRYPYIYDYNSVYTDDVTQFLPKDHTCDIIDLPTDINLNLNLNLQLVTPSPPPSEICQLSTPQTPISSTFGNSSFASSHTDETSSIQTKTRDFITGQLISRTNNNSEHTNFFSHNNSLSPSSPPPTLFNSHKCVTLSNFIFNSSDESDL